MMLFFSLRLDRRVWELVSYAPPPTHMRALFRDPDALLATRVGLYGTLAELYRAIDSIADHAFAYGTAAAVRHG